jgi:protein involved in polysaccharide export with SLBB domain
MKFKILVFFSIFNLLTEISISQSLSDIEKLKVELLSDIQLNEILQQAKDQGLNESQFVKMVRERGMPTEEVQKLQNRIISLRQAGLKTRSLQKSILSQEGVEATQGVILETDLAELSILQQKIFGYSLFYNKELNFNPSLNIPTPQGYILGAGDQILIDIYGASQKSYDLKVSPEGKILVPNVGPIIVGGSTIASATSRIKTALTQIYSGLAFGNTFLDIRLGNIRTVSVALVGELNHPGNYTLPAFASPFNALFAAGGPNENGSFRHIQVYRDSKLLNEIDIYDFLIKGSNSSPITLHDNDVIIVPPVRARVELAGPVRREGFFELKPNENLINLLSFAGGFKPNAYTDRLTLTRMTGTERKIVEVEATAFASFVPKDGDNFRIGEILERFENRVQISGAILRPGSYALDSGLTASQLIQKAQGLRPDAYANRAILYRTQSDYSIEVLPIEAQLLISGKHADIQLQPEDLIHIPSRYDLKEDYYVKISGQINNPGSFAFAENMRVIDLVSKAGGFKESAASSKIEIVRRVLNDVSGKLSEIITIEVDKNFILDEKKQSEVLKPFDHVIVRKSPGYQREQIVKVEGEVFFPGEYALTSSNETVYDLIARSGGVTKFAYIEGATLIRKNDLNKKISDEIIGYQNLMSVKSNFKNDSLNLTEPGKILISKIENTIEKNRRDQKSDISSDIQSMVKKENLIQFSESTEGMSQYKIKDFISIGINLREILEQPHGEKDLILVEGDILSLPRKLNTVNISGQVFSPNTAIYKEGKKLGYYISQSGGFTDNSRKGRAYVVYANGSIRRTRTILNLRFYPKIEPGSEIIVPEIPASRKFNPQLLLNSITGLLTSSLGLFVLIRSL